MSQPAYEPLERRPIQSRDTQWARAAAQLPARVGVSPNSISLFGMSAAITAGLAFPASCRLPWGEARAVLLVVIAGGILSATRRLGRAATYSQSSTR